MTGLATLLGLALGLYGLGVWRLHRRRRAWPRWRLAVFALAALGTIAVLVPPLSHWGHHDFRGHMMVHLVVAMVAPVGLVFAAPVTLALKNLPAAWGKRWVRLLNTPTLRLLCHPITAAVLNVGGLYALYLTDLYSLMLRSPAFAVWLHWHFLLAGCLFTWAIAGPDPAPRRPGIRLRLAVLVVSMVAHGVLAKWMYRFQLPREEHWLVVQQGAEWMFYLGELPEAFLVFVLLRQWSKWRFPTPAPPTPQRTL
ncbi:cytochrome c oxidase assembly protein [Salinicola aestuarinus]|uniref:cytochrome c oxidase assembly protein n=1 Tax=Salinicola aestuarinus TaxID=1949082 RepID=UPI000DA1EF7C|nr:cytochrome c oxidase assembly protein [Salinicola aestuarinus]